MGWVPAHQAHAVERCALSVQFSELIATKPWQALLSAAAVRANTSDFNVILEEMQASLPGNMGLGQAMQVQPASPGQPGFLGLPGTAPTGVAQGRMFQAVVNNELREELVLHRGRFAYSSMAYQGWTSFLERARSLLEEGINSAAQVVEISFIRLEYWDRFAYDGPREAAAYTELLVPGTKYLSTLPADTSELWHSHVGYFLPAAQTGRRLINLNVDVADVADPLPSSTANPVPTRSVSVYTMVQDALPRTAGPSSFNDVSTRLDDIHKSLKAALGEVITTEMADRIALQPRTRS